ncbi:type VI secretion system-associated FHA domain protein TagH [Neptunicella marina]|uniref:Type VI secretion system-associated FHA domain protein TagH n=1 Tax=Neptunicella marina TaxID=2125989 RepID=A0A8J6LZL3_9ALTE|nr:type VI secretion system-associated FHA domain protein TagH [Neptunicella marina]
MLTLQITSYQNASSSQPKSQTLDNGKITIGRDITNQWCLSDPDRVLSKNHCYVERVNNQYVLTDTSTNGVFINGSKEAIGRGNSVTLKDGDSFSLSDYQIDVLIGTLAPAIPQPETPVNPQPPVTPVVPDPTPAYTSPPPNNVAADDWKAMLDSPASGASEPETQNVPDVPDFTQAHYDAPSVGMSIPEDWSMESPDNTQNADNGPGITQPPVAPTPLPNQESEPQTAQPPQPLSDTGAEAAAIQAQSNVTATPAPAQSSTTPVANNSDLLQAFLKGAGLDANLNLQSNPQELMQELGTLFRTTTLGLMGILATRGDIKSEFRLSQTMIKPTENNPLKFSLNIDEAMVALISKKGAGYMPAEEAFSEAFEDIKAHQVAVLAGMQSALQSLMNRFDPQNITGTEQVSGVKKILGGQKSQHWDAFVSLYNRLKQESQDDFQSLFGRDFGKAYEQQIQNQKNHKT